MGDYYREFLNVPLVWKPYKLLKKSIIRMLLERNGNVGYII